MKPDPNQLVFPFLWLIEPVEGAIVSGLVRDDWMTWAWLRTDDKFPRLPAVRSLPVEAKWLLVVLLSHCAEQESDGLIAKRDMPMLLAVADLKQPKKSLDLLLNNGQVVLVKGDYFVPLYLEMNRTHEQEQHERELGRIRQANWRRLHLGNNPVTNPVTNDFASDGTGLDGTVVPLQEDQQREVDREGERPEIQAAAKQWSEERLQKSRNRETPQ
jgi:hypothetical protein